jgi:hypothetical protein
VLEKPKAIVVGDRHARGCAAELTETLGKNFEVIGSVMAGTSSKFITNRAKEEISKLTKEGVVVVWAERNDIPKNASRYLYDLEHITDFVKNSKLSL